MHVAHPVPAGLGRRADPRVAESIGVAQGVHVRAVLVDPCAQLIGSADGPVAGDDDIDIGRHAVEQPQCGEVVLDRVSGVKVEHRNQDIGKHVAGDENPALLDQQRRMARGVGLVLDDPDRRAIPGNPRRFGGQAGDQAEQVQRDLPGDFRPARSSAMSAFQSAVGQLHLEPWPRSGLSRSGALRRARRARGRDPNGDASRSLPRRAGPTREGRSRGRPFRRRSLRGR